MFQALEAKKIEIMDKFDYTKKWSWTGPCEKHRRGRIRTESIGYGIYDKEHWDEIIDFFADSIFKLKTVFDPLLDDIMRNVKTK